MTDSPANSWIPPAGPFTRQGPRLFRGDGQEIATARAANEADWILQRLNSAPSAPQDVDAMCRAIVKTLRMANFSEAVPIVTAIIRKHIPDRRPAGLTLTADEQATVDGAWRSIGRDPAHWHANGISGTRGSMLLAIIDRLTAAPPAAVPPVTGGEP